MATTNKNVFLSKQPAFMVKHVMIFLLKYNRIEFYSTGGVEHHESNYLQKTGGICL